MQNRMRLAEVKLVRQRVSVYGGVVQMSKDRVIIRLQIAPSDRMAMPSGEPAEILIMANRVLYTASARIQGLADDLLILSICGSIRTIQRRGHERYPCAIAMDYRAIHPDGCVGVWQHAITTDLSQGGACLVLDPAITLPQRMEILFMLPQELMDGTQTEPLLGGMDRELNSPIRTMARVIHRVSNADGSTVIGLAFIGMPQLDQIRLLRFLNEALHANVF